MTTEERIEEMLHHAYERGYYHQVIEKAEELSKTHPKMGLYERYETAYTSSKKEFYENRSTGEQSY